jgi:phage tail-like protein
VASVARGLVEGLVSPRPIAEQLPAALQEDEFCVRMMGAFDESLAPIFSTLDCLSTYFDPDLAPDDFVDWLASWVGLDIDETWSIERRRQLIHRAVDLYRMRGTALGLATHIQLYAGVTPQIEDSGGCTWSQTASNPFPGSAQPRVTVRLDVDDAATVKMSTVRRIVDSNRPAHVPFRIEIASQGSAADQAADGPAGSADQGSSGAPGAVELPGSERIELAPPAPLSQEEIEEQSIEPPDEPDPAG